MKRFTVEGRSIELYDPNEKLPQGTTRVIDTSGQTLCYALMTSDDPPNMREKLMMEAVKRLLRLKAQNLTNPKFIYGEPILVTGPIGAKIERMLEKPKSRFYIPIISTALSLWR
jgi:hypothetical protein